MADAAEKMVRFDLFDRGHFSADSEEEDTESFEDRFISFLESQVAAAWTTGKHTSGIPTAMRPFRLACASSTSIPPSL
jgi:hypothetical protein